MACANVTMDVIEDHSGIHTNQGDEAPLIKHYKASELVPASKHPLHQLLKREPSVWAAMQISSGVLSIGLGVMFAATSEMKNLLLTLFRVPIVSGILFLVAGFFSMQLYRYPVLLQMCFQSNIFCLVVSTVGAVLLSVDLDSEKAAPRHYQVETMLLCVTVLDVLVSIILMGLIHAEKRRQEKK